MFSKERQKRSGSRWGGGGEEPGGVKGGEIIIMIYDVRKKLFSKKEKNKIFERERERHTHQKH